MVRLKVATGVGAAVTMMAVLSGSATSGAAQAEPPTAVVGGSSAPAAAPVPDAIERVSLATDGSQAFPPFGTAVSDLGLSADGMLVGFASLAALQPADTNGLQDVYVRDRSTSIGESGGVVPAGYSELISATPAGASGVGMSSGIELSADGRYAVFASIAADLVPGDTNGTWDVFLRDRWQQTTSAVSVTPAGSVGNGLSRSLMSITADGRYVVFTSLASDLVPGDTNASPDVFRRDMQTGQTTRVSVTSSGEQVTGEFISAGASDDGGVVAFASSAPTLVSGDTNGSVDVFVKDMATGIVSRVSVTSNGAQAFGGGATGAPAISADGRHVAFLSRATNLRPTGGAAVDQIYRHDRVTGQTVLVSRSSAGYPSNGEVITNPAMSADGQVIVFGSSATELVPDDFNPRMDLFRHSLSTGTTERLSVSGGKAGNANSGGSGGPDITPDGRLVAFNSDASNLVPGDTNARGDTFVVGPPAAPAEVVPTPDAEELAAQIPPVAVPTAPAGQVVVDDGPPGFRVVIESAGGIGEWQDVQVRPDRAAMGGIADSILASPAFKIDVPAEAPSFTSARLTLPYQEQLLAGYPEADLRVHRYDEATGFWLPITAGQVIDQAANSISVDVTGFSTYAVLRVRDTAQWRQLFQSVPVQCVAGSETVVDAALVLDNSNSMSTNDPDRLRLSGAKRFVAEMRATDRAGVIRFATSASVRLPLTTLATPTNRTSVDSAIDSAGSLSGGTNIGAGIRAATTMLSGGTGVRVRAAIVLTDGQNDTGGSPSKQTLDAQTLAAAEAAATAGVSVYTLGLSSAPDAQLLTTVAQRTGGTYTALSSPDQLVPVYQRLVGTLIDDGTDTDRDGLSDCVERNGAFVPGGIVLRDRIGQATSVQQAAFITTDPNQADSDGDGLRDGEELTQRRFSDYPYLDETYGFLRDAGLSRFYAYTSDPNKADTDGDFFDDAEERINGTDPLRPDFDQLGGQLGIAGLGLPPFTLFQPVSYGGAPAVRDYLAYVPGKGIVPRRHSPLVVAYDTSDNCVSDGGGGASGAGYCDELFRLARERPDRERFSVCWLTPSRCSTDAEQVRDLIREVRAAQGLFTADGLLTRDFTRRQAQGTCTYWTGDQAACTVAATAVTVTPPAALPAEVTRTVRTAKPAGAGIRVDPALARRIADVLLRTGNTIAVTEGVVTGPASQSEVEGSVRRCYETGVLSVYRRTSLYLHPCETQPIFLPAADMAEATAHDLDAIAANPARGVLSYATEAENSARGYSASWYRAPTFDCSDAARPIAAAARPGVSLQCDELPYASTYQAGPPSALPPGPGTSLRFIRAADNIAEGRSLQDFYRKCNLKQPAVLPQQRTLFLVAPQPTAPRTVGLCSGR